MPLSRAIWAILCNVFATGESSGSSDGAHGNRCTSTSTPSTNAVRTASEIDSGTAEWRLPSSSETERDAAGAATSGALNEGIAAESNCHRVCDVKSGIPEGASTVRRAGTRRDGEYPTHVPFRYSTERRFFMERPSWRRRRNNAIRWRSFHSGDVALSPRSLGQSQYPLALEGGPRFGRTEWIEGGLMPEFGDSPALWRAETARS